MKTKTITIVALLSLVSIAGLTPASAQIEDCAPDGSNFPDCVDTDPGSFEDLLGGTGAGVDSLICPDPDATPAICTEPTLTGAGETVDLLLGTDPDDPFGCEVNPASTECGLLNTLADAVEFVTGSVPDLAACIGNPMDTFEACMDALLAPLSGPLAYEEAVEEALGLCFADVAAMDEAAFESCSAAVGAILAVEDIFGSDTTPPVITDFALDALGGDAYLNIAEAGAGTVFTITMDEDDNPRIEANDGAGNWATSSTFDGSYDHPTSQFTLTTPIPEGDYELRANATDAAGNEAMWFGNLQFTVDLTAPDTTITTIGDQAAVGNMFNKDDVDALGGIIEFVVATTHTDIASIELMDGASLVGALTDGDNDGTYEFSMAFPADGDYTYDIVSTDLAGNTLSLDADFSVDVTGPVATFDAIAEFGGDFTFNQDDFAAYGGADPSVDTVNLAWTMVPAEMPGDATLWTLDAMGNLDSQVDPDGSPYDTGFTYDADGTDVTYRLVLIDDVNGNAGNAPELNLVIDLTSPTTSWASPTGGASDLFVNANELTGDLVWSLNDAEDGMTFASLQVRYDSGSGFNNWGGHPGTIDGANGEINLGVMSQFTDGTYQFRAIFIDEAGNQGILEESDPIEFDTVLESISFVNVAEDTTDDNPNFDADLNEDEVVGAGTLDFVFQSAATDVAGVGLEYSTDGMTFTPMASGNSLVVAVPEGSLPGDGEYTMRATLSDTAGNEVTTTFSMILDRVVPGDVGPEFKMNGNGFTSPFQLDVDSNGNPTDIFTLEFDHVDSDIETATLTYTVDDGSGPGPVQTVVLGTTGSINKDLGTIVGEMDWNLVLTDAAGNFVDYSGTHEFLAPLKVLANWKVGGQTIMDPRWVGPLQNGADAVTYEVEVTARLGNDVDYVIVDFDEAKDFFSFQSSNINDALVVLDVANQNLDYIDMGSFSVDDGFSGSFTLTLDADSALATVDSTTVTVRMFNALDEELAAITQVFEVDSIDPLTPMLNLPADGGNDQVVDYTEYEAGKPLVIDFTMLDDDHSGFESLELTINSADHGLSLDASDLIGTTGQLTLPALPDGLYGLEATVTDKVGNSNTNSLVFTLEALQELNLVAAETVYLQPGATGQGQLLYAGDKIVDNMEDYFLYYVPTNGGRILLDADLTNAPGDDIGLQNGRLVFVVAKEGYDAADLIGGNIFDEMLEITAAADAIDGAAGYFELRPMVGGSTNVYTIDDNKAMYVVIDDTLPTVSSNVMLLDDANGDRLLSAFELAAPDNIQHYSFTASDDNLLVDVELFELDSFGDISSPDRITTFDLDLLTFETDLDDGVYDMRIVVTDAAGNQQSADLLQFEVNTLAQLLGATDPTSIRVSETAIENDELNTILYIDGVGTIDVDELRFIQLDSFVKFSDVNGDVDTVDTAAGPGEEIAIFELELADQIEANFDNAADADTNDDDFQIAIAQANSFAGVTHGETSEMKVRAYNNGAYIPFASGELTVDLIADIEGPAVNFHTVGGDYAITIGEASGTHQFAFDLVDQGFLSPNEPTVWFKAPGDVGFTEAGLIECIETSGVEACLSAGVPFLDQDGQWIIKVVAEDDLGNVNEHQQAFQVHLTVPTSGDITEAGVSIVGEDVWVTDGSETTITVTVQNDANYDLDRIYLTSAGTNSVGSVDSPGSTLSHEDLYVTEVYFDLSDPIAPGDSFTETLSLTTLTAMPSATNTWTLVAEVDENGDTVQSIVGSFDFQIDTVPHDVTVAFDEGTAFDVAPGYFSEIGSDLDFIVANNEVDAVEVTIDVYHGADLFATSDVVIAAGDTAFLVTLPEAPDGTWTVEVSHEDEAGNQGSDDVSGDLAIQPRIVLTMEDAFTDSLLGTTTHLPGGMFTLSSDFAPDADREQPSDVFMVSHNSEAALDTHGAPTMVDGDGTTTIDLDLGTPEDVDFTIGGAHGTSETWGLDFTSVYTPILVDAADNVLDADAVMIFVLDNQVDSAVLTLLAQDGEDFDFRVDATDASGLDTVTLEHRVPGDLWAALGAIDVDISTGTVDLARNIINDGNYEIRAEVTDDLGNTGYSNVVEVSVNEDAIATIELLDGATDVIGGDLFVVSSDEKSATIRVSNGAEEPAIDYVTVTYVPAGAPDANDNLITKVTGMSTANYLNGRVISFTFDGDIAGGETVDYPITLTTQSGVTYDTFGNWKIEATTVTGTSVMLDADDVLEFDIRGYVELAEPELDIGLVSITQDGDDLTTNGGVYIATVDAGFTSENQDTSDDDAITIVVDVTTDAMGDPIPGIDITLSAGLIDLGTATTDVAGEATFTFEPEDADMDFSEVAFTYAIVEGVYDVDGDKMVRAQDGGLDAIATGLVGHIEAVSTVVSIDSGDPELSSEACWMHDIGVIVDDVRSYDFTGCVPVVGGGGSHFTLTDDVGGQTIAAIPGEVDTDYNVANLDVDVGYGTALVEDTPGTGDAGTHRFGLEFSGTVPHGVLTETTTVDVLYTAIVLEATTDGLAAFDTEDFTFTVTGRYAHDVDFNGDAIDQYDLQHDVVLGDDFVGQTLLAADDVLVVDMLCSAAYTLSGTSAVDVYSATFDRMCVELGALTITAGERDSWAPAPVEVELAIDGGALVDTYLGQADTYTDVFFGQSNVETIVEANGDDIAPFTLSSANFDHSSQLEDTDVWYIDLTPEFDAGEHILHLDLPVGEVGGEPIVLSHTFDGDATAVSKVSYEITYASSDAADESDVNALWVTSDAALETIFDVTKVVDDGSGTTETAAADDSRVIVTNGLDEEILTVATGQATYSQIAGGVRTENIKVAFYDVDSDDGVVIEPEGGETVATIGGAFEQARYFTHIVATFTDSVNAPSGEEATADAQLTWAHDGTVAPDVTATADDGVVVLTDDEISNELGNLRFRFTSNADAATITVTAVTGVGAHGITLVDSNSIDLSWFDLTTSVVSLEESQTAAQGSWLPDAGDDAEFAAGTYVRMTVQLNLDDGTTEEAVDNGQVRIGGRLRSVDADGQVSIIYYFGSAGELTDIAINPVTSTVDNVVYNGGTGVTQTITWV